MTIFRSQAELNDGDQYFQAITNIIFTVRLINGYFYFTWTFQGDHSSRISLGYQYAMIKIGEKSTKASQEFKEEWNLLPNPIFK